MMAMATPVLAPVMLTRGPEKEKGQIAANDLAQKERNMNTQMDSTVSAPAQNKSRLAALIESAGGRVVPPMVVAAQHLLGLGLHPHWLGAPVPGDKSTGKAPIAHGWQNAPRPTATALRETYPTDGNVGLRTGRSEGGVGIVVVDCDSDAALSWAREHLPVTPIKAKTGKGEHWYYRYPDGEITIRNKAKIKTSDGTKIEMDLRADGGQVVAPPSIHYTGRRYEEIEPWTVDGIQAMPVFDPAWFPVAEAAPRAVNTIESADLTADESEREACARLWLSEDSRAEIVSEGERDQRLTVVISTLAQAFGLRADRIEALAWEWAQKYLTMGDDVQEWEWKCGEKAQRFAGTTDSDPTRAALKFSYYLRKVRPASAPSASVTPAVTVAQNVIWARVSLKQNGEDGSKGAIQVVYAATGQRVDVPLVPTKEGDYQFVARELTGYFAAALSAELGETVDTDQFTMDEGVDEGAAPFPIMGDTDARRAWLRANKTSAGKWCCATLITAKFGSLLPVALTVSKSDKGYPTYTWGAAPAGSPTTEFRALDTALNKPAGVDLPAAVASENKIAINDEAYPHADRPRYALVHAAIQALAERADVYVRDGKVVEVVEDGATAKITNIETARAQTVLSDPSIATWIRWERTPADVRKAGGPKQQAVAESTASKDVTASVLAEGRYPTLRPLSLVTSAPQFRADGTAQTQRGYDRATRTFLTASADLPSPGETVSEAVAAAKTLMGLLKDFPFVEPRRSRAIWLSCLFTRLARASIAGAVPMFASSGNAAGLGKGLLWDVITRIADGQDQPSSTGWQKGERDFKDEIVSTLISAPAMARIDNVPGASRLDSATLASLLTSYPYYDSRGKGDREQGRFEAQTVWCTSGIGLRMSTELATRTLEIVIATDDPYHDQRAMPDIEGMATRDRAKYLHAALTILRAWHCAGRPTMQGKTIRSNYRAWASIAQQCVLWLASLPGLEGELTDPVAARVAGTNDEDSDMGEFLLIWEQLGAVNPAKAMRAAEAWDRTRARLDPEPKVKALRDYLSERCREPSAADLSTLLASIKPRTGEGRVIACVDGVKRTLKRTASNGYYVVSAPLPC